MQDNKNTLASSSNSQGNSPQRKTPPVITDSLRFSYEFDRDSTFSDGNKSIQFDFEDYPNEREYQFKLEANNQTMESSGVTRKLQIFEKYKQNNEEQHRTSDIVDSFDKIFKLKGQEGESNSTKYLFKKKTANLEDPATKIPESPSKDKIAQQSKDFKQSISTQNSKSISNETGFVMEEIPFADVIKQCGGGNLLNNVSESNSIQCGASNNLSQRNTFDPFNLSYLGMDRNIGRADIANTFISDVSAPEKSNHDTIMSINFPDGLSQSTYEESTLLLDKTGQQNLTNHLAIPKIQSKNSNLSGLDSQTSKSSGSIQVQPYPKVGNGSNKSIPSPKIIITYSNPQKVISPAVSSNNLNLDLSSNQTIDNPIKSSINTQKTVLNIQTKTSLNEQVMLNSPIFAQELRIAPFLRKVRKMNSIYPNLNHPHINLEAQSKFCNILAGVFEEALQFLIQMTKRIFERVKQPKFFPSEFSNINYFLNSNWELDRLQQRSIINNGLKPRSNFYRSQINEQKIKNALDNYRTVILHYKDRQLDLNTQEGMKAYFRIREKFWNLEKNMRSISQDIYQIYPETDYPQFYYDYLNVLRAPTLVKTEQNKIKKYANVLQTVLMNQQLKQPLSCSKVGQSVKEKIEKELKDIQGL